MAEWLVVGAGFTGATIAERLASSGHRVIVIDRKEYVGGTASDYIHETGLLVQRYGPHVFHTNSDKIWEYMKRFGEWRFSRYRVSAFVNGSYVSLPLGFEGLDRLFPSESDKIKDILLRKFGAGAKVPIYSLLKDPELQNTGGSILAFIYAGYTKKHWGMPYTALDKSVLSRVPLIVGDQEEYHSDKHQGIPELGYSELIRNMLDHPNIHVLLEMEFSEIQDSFTDSKIVFTGQIDEYFKFQAGKLPYRSVRFETRVEKKEFALPVETVNYPNDHQYTRVTEAKRITGQTSDSTVLIYDFPCSYEHGRNEALYPIPCADGRASMSKYDEAVASIGTTFCGRLGEYRYYNMDQAVASALHIFEKRLA